MNSPCVLSYQSFSYSLEKLFGYHNIPWLMITVILISCLFGSVYDVSWELLV